MEISGGVGGIAERGVAAGKERGKAGRQGDTEERRGTLQGFGSLENGAVMEVLNLL